MKTEYNANYDVLEDIDAAILIDAACRYCNSQAKKGKFVDLDAVLAIIGIDKYEVIENVPEGYFPSDDEMEKALKEIDEDVTAR